MATSYLAPGVYVEEVSGGSRPIEGVGTSVAGFIGFAEKGPYNTPTLVTNWTQFRSTFGDFIDGAYLAHSVYGYFNNGGGVCYVVRLGSPESAKAAQQPAHRAIPSRAGIAGGSLQVSALPEAPEGVVVEIASTAIDRGTLPPGDKAPGKRPGAPAGAAAKEGGEAEGDGPGVPGAPGAPGVQTTEVDDRFNMTIRAGATREVFENLSTKRSDPRYVETIVNEGRNRSKLLHVELKTESTAVEPAQGATSLPLEMGLFNLEPAQASVALTSVTPAQYVGDTAERVGLGGFDAIDELTIVSAPDLMSAYEKGWIDGDGVRAVQQALIDHCERNGDRVAILDPLPGMKPHNVKDWRMNEVGYDSSFATMYYPWIQVNDPVTNKTINIPPSGHIAGVWARVDSERGVHKAPANESIRGCTGIEFQVTTEEQTLLNPVGINCVRSFPGRGIRIWGARTLSSDPEWRYLNVRRLFNFVRESITQGTQWAVFEPNNVDLWLKMKRDVSSFLSRVYLTGALFGATEREAFYVKCDSETNPPAVIDAGQVICEVGISPTKPAEFVIFRVSQASPGAEA